MEHGSECIGIGVIHIGHGLNGRGMELGMCLILRQGIE